VPIVIETFAERVASTSSTISVDRSAAGVVKHDIVTSVALPGSPTTTTQSAGDNSTKIATTAFVVASVAAGPSGSGGGRTLISAQLLAAPAATVSFGSIPTTYQDLEIQIFGRGTNATTSVECRMQFNADTAGNYDWIRENRFGVNTAVASTYMEIASVAAGSAPAGTATLIPIQIHRYRNTTWNKTVQCYSPLKVDTTTNGQVVSRGGAAWRSTAAITSIDVFLSAGNWDVDSDFRLYGIS
jgi:hypothetical protein